MNAEVEQRGSSCRENPAVIKQILDHLERLAGPATRVGPSPVHRRQRHYRA